MRYYQLKYRGNYIIYIVLLILLPFTISDIIYSNNIDFYQYELTQLGIVLCIVLIIAIINKIRKNIYNKKLKKNIEAKELYYLDTWIMCYGSRYVEEKFDYLLVFKDNNNKKYIAQRKSLNGNYKCKIYKDGFKLFYKNKGEINQNQKFKVYIDEDYGYTIYDKKSKKLVLKFRPFAKEKMDLNKELTKYAYIMMNQEANFLDFDDAIYFKGMIEL